MDKKVAFQVAATAITFAVSMQAANATSQNVSSSAAPTWQVVTGAQQGSYVVSTFSFMPSPNVTMNYDAAATGVVAGDTAIVTSANTTKGSRTYAGAVGALSSTARACQTTDVTANTAAPSAIAATVSACTF